MIPRSVDAVVVGCGAAGLGAAAALAARGRKVVGLEQFEFGHTRGSSHGTERIVRVAYADAIHAEMAVQSLDQWRQLERDTDTTLLTPTGGLDIGDRDEINMLAARCAEVGVDVERFTIADAAVRFPMFRFDDSGDGATERAVMFHSAAATVNADNALLALRTFAERRGSTFISGVRVHTIEPVTDDWVIVHFDGGSVEASSCIVASGAWGGDSLVRSALGDGALPPLRVTQEQVAFYRPVETVGWPTFVDRGDPSLYGLPTPDGLMKVGEHHTGQAIAVDTKTDTLEPASWERLQRWVTEHMPGLDPVPVRSATCLYASFPGDTFLLDRRGPIVVGLGLSGHGFKFAPEVGRRLADLADRVADPSNPFSFARPPLDVGASGQR